MKVPVPSARNKNDKNKPRWQLLRRTFTPNLRKN